MEQVKLDETSFVTLFEDADREEYSYSLTYTEDGQQWETERIRGFTDRKTAIADARELLTGFLEPYTSQASGGHHE
jgi:hypothetical protein